MAWSDGRTFWYGLVQSIYNGSKHFIRENAKGTQKIEGYSMGEDTGQGPYGQSYLAIEVSQTNLKNMEICCLRSSFGSGVISCGSTTDSARSRDELALLGKFQTDYAANPP
jgi:hypothetical protein